MRSMTGCGRAELAGGDGLRVAVELQSVNHRQFEARIDLPDGLSAIEAELRKKIHARIARGSVLCRVRLDASVAARRKSACVDLDLARTLVERLRQAGRKLNLRDDLGLSALLALPDLVRVAPAVEQARRLGVLALKCADQALARLLQRRALEGRELARDLGARLRVLDGLVGQIAARAPLVADRYRQALRKRLSGAGVSFRVDDERLVRELALFADRCDITEELTRLRSHLKQARDCLLDDAPGGRTLDFLAQEMLREASTIAAKANDAEVVGLVIKSKTELERIREQSQNVE